MSPTSSPLPETPLPTGIQAISSRRPGRRRKQVHAVVSVADHCAILARRLDILAGCELQHGHVAAAERLAWRAAALREAGR